MKTLHLETVDSTNNFVKQHIDEIENLTFVYADRQTSGRGRLERKWIDTGEDNLFLTIVIKPDSKNTDLSHIPNYTQYLCVILSMVLEEEFKLEPKIKWPNDILINNNKIAGILAEGTTKGTNFTGLALGVGVNLNTSKENLDNIDKPATSIFNETGNKISKEIFIEKLYSKFCLLYDRFVCEGFTSIQNEYVKRAQFIGENISINILGEIHKGLAESISEDGSLILKENNKINKYYIGDIL